MVVSLNSAHPGVRFVSALMEYKNHSFKCYAYLKYETLCNTSLKVSYYKAVLHRRMVHTASYAMFMVTWCCSECCVTSGLDFETATGSVVRYCPIICFKGIESL